MNPTSKSDLIDTGERIIPAADGEVSLVFSRHRFAYEYATQFVTNNRVIDVGCGTGYGCRLMADEANQVVGIDHDADAVAYCRAHYSAPNIEFRQLDVRSLDFDDEFDVAASFQVIEHVHDTDDFVRRMKRAVRRGGTILISTPNVRTVRREGEGNPFHFSEMNHEQFTTLIDRHFAEYRLLGIGYSSPNRVRALIQRLPLYRWIGLRLRRNSRIKSVAARAMDATQFAVLEDRVAESAIDLLAVCENDNRVG